MTAHVQMMDDAELDKAVVAAVFAQAAGLGWRGVDVAAAAVTAGLPLDRVRQRFPGRGAVLLRFGLMADTAALAGTMTEAVPRERLFDMLMARFDLLQQHRAGVLELLRALPADPGAAVLLKGATLRSMRWLLGAAGVPTRGVLGLLRVNGLLLLWLYALRAWQADESADLSGTMAAVDRGLDRALQAEASWPWREVSPAEAAAEVFEAEGMLPPATAPA